MRPRRGPLKNAQKEMTNLIGLRYERMHELTGESQLYWAKCRAFVAYLLDPSTILGEKERPGRDALIEYLREVYKRPTAHSSDALDDALGVPVETLRDPWYAWLANF